MEINYQFRQRYSVIHTPDRYDRSALPNDNETVVTSEWLVSVPSEADVVLLNAARDLVDYFFVSMGLSLRLIRDEEYTGGARIRYGVDGSVAERSYRLCVSENEILLIGNTSRLDMYPNEHLINIVHSGVDAILAFVKDIDITPHGYHDFNDLCYRAAQYGIDVYAYSYLHNRLHPEDEGAEEFYENLYGKLLDRCPYFKGIIFVGESCEFPSKDPHTEMVRRKDNYKDGKPIPNTKPYPGWWPCYDYPIWLEMVSRIMRKRRPDLDIVLWSYNWCRVDASYRKALVDTLPKDVTLQATYEMGGFVERDGIKNTTADYTIFRR